MARFETRELTSEDRAWVRSFITENWGSPVVVVHSDTFHPADLHGFVAVHGDKRVGLITYGVLDFNFMSEEAEAFQMANSDYSYEQHGAFDGQVVDEAAMADQALVNEIREEIGLTDGGALSDEQLGINADELDVSQYADEPLTDDTETAGFASAEIAAKAGAAVVVAPADNATLRHTVETWLDSVARARAAEAAHGLAPTNHARDAAAALLALIHDPDLVQQAMAAADTPIREPLEP
ncbi:hypothetical protein ACFL6C_11045 [Myxococcota bacterium]